MEEKKTKKTIKKKTNWSRFKTWNSFKKRELRKIIKENKKK